MGITGLWLAFGWGLAEGSYFFILPDVILGWTALKSIRAGLKQTAACLAGAVIAGSWLFGFSLKDRARAEASVQRVPFVRTWMSDRVREEYLRYGIWAPAIGPVRGIPYKIYAVQAPEHMSFIQFVSISLPARLWRFIAVVTVFGFVGIVFRQRWPDRWKIIQFSYAILWVIFYAVYWSMI
jgi:hypothetical protein